MPDQTIPVFRPSCTDAEKEAVCEVLDSGWWGMGPKTAQFEREFAAYVGAPYAVATNSATAALHLALLACGVREGDEVLVPAITFASTALAALYCGATPVFVDVERDTLCIDVGDLWRKSESQRAAAIIPVHYGGHACRMDKILELAWPRRLIVVDDAAHACGAEYRGGRIGGLDTDATCFSFHPVKNLATPDGGMITVRWEKLAEKLRRMRWCGIDKSTWSREGDAAQSDFAGYGWYYEVAELGYKYHMNDIAAAIGLVQLARLDEMNARRRAIVGQYNEAFADLGWLELPVEHDYTRSAHHNYVVKLGNRDGLNLHLKRRGIASGVHYMPLYLHPLFRQFATACPVADEVWTKLLTLPLYSDMTEDDVGRVIRAVKEFRQ